VVETSYSLIAALERYKYDADCDLFLTILNHELSEDVYRDQTRLLTKLEQEFATAAASATNDKESNINNSTNNHNQILLKSKIRHILKKLLPAKSDASMSKLLAALDMNDPHEQVRYQLLFLEDRDGNQGAFLEEFRDQHLQEAQEFLIEIQTQLLCISNEYQQITVEQIEHLLYKLDPQKSVQQRNRYICTGFGVTMRSSLALDLVINVQKFCLKLRNNILVQRTGKQLPQTTKT
jgi:hypothetical protein